MIVVNCPRAEVGNSAHNKNATTNRTVNECAALAPHLPD
jgi:hypothetical protein